MIKYKKKLPIKRMYLIDKFSHSISVEVKNMNKDSLKMRVPGAKQAIEKMKYEIANEFGVNLGPDATSRANGSVGGEITKRLVQNGLNNISGSYTQR